MTPLEVHELGQKQLYTLYPKVRKIKRYKINKYYPKVDTVMDIFSLLKVQTSSIKFQPTINPGQEMNMQVRKIRSRYSCLSLHSF